MTGKLLCGTRLISAFALAVGLFLIVATPAAASDGLLEEAPVGGPAHAAAGPRPLFQLPFACGQRVQLATYPGHDDYDIDMTLPDFND